jgi:hypothetical protein
MANSQLLWGKWGPNIAKAMFSGLSCALTVNLLSKQVAQQLTDAEGATAYVCFWVDMTQMQQNVRFDPKRTL